MTEPNLACRRAGLLLSLRDDGAATPQQADELDRHLATCEACRRAARADRAVGDRLRERARGGVRPGFAAAVVAAAIRERTVAAAQNRMLRWAAAAAAFVATISLAATAAREVPAGRAESARDAAREAVLVPRAFVAPSERR
jgi:anti-sigma factor RsiW